MRIPLLNLLTASAEATTAEAISTTEEYSFTTIMSLTNPDGSVIGADQAIDAVTENVTSWWEKLDLVNRLITILPNLVVAILTIIIGIFAAKFAVKIVHKALTAKGVDQSVHAFIASIVKLVVLVIFFVSALSKFGFNINTFIAAIGAAGVTAGLGLQASVAQFASGIQILINHPFKNGDFVEVAGSTGSVADIHLMYTVLITPDNKKVIIPNSSITTSNIVNYSAENKRRVDFAFDISYASDIAQAKNIVLGLALASEFSLKDPEPVVFVGSHEASSIRLVARVWSDTDKYWDLFFELEEKVKLAFDKEGINIPFNQLDVHIINN